MDSILLTTTTNSGNYYFKPTLFGLVLYVEKIYTYSDKTEIRTFEKANVSDIFSLNLIKSNIP